MISIITITASFLFPFKILRNWVPVSSVRFSRVLSPHLHLTSYFCVTSCHLSSTDEDGIRTGASLESCHHLPPIIQLAAISGYVFYPCQPKNCRKCGSHEHLATECHNLHCKNCKINEHLTKDCPHPMKCNLCGEEQHTFRTCPKSYANRVRAPQQQEQRQTTVEDRHTSKCS
uniref:CCHC-type domain-containing protein n=1 Tax=Fundulus heteroclitus TaxID=8078 RepID=A0A3Q2Q6N8_FUNHE